MPLETVTTVADLNADWPLDSDEKNFGDDHIRNIKKALKALANTTTVLPSADGSATGELRLLELPANGVNYVGVKAPAALAADVMWTLPPAQGVAGSVLTNAGDGTLSWVVPAVPVIPAATIMQMSEAVSVVPGLLLPLFTNPSAYAYKLLRAHCYGLNPVAPFSVKIKRVSPASVNPDGYVFDMFYTTSLTPTEAIPAFDRFTSHDILQLEVTSAGGTGSGPAIISIAYQIYPS